MSIKEFLASTPNKTYVDYNASTPVLKEVLDEMMPYFSSCFYNMSNPYATELQDYVEELRQNILKELGANSGKIVFSSGATESLNGIIQGVALNSVKKGETGKNVIVSSVEHDAVIVCGKELQRLGVEVRICPVNRKGEIDLEVLKNLIDKETILVSILHVNNETGVIQPIEEISAICKKQGVLFHSDGVLAVGRVDISNVSDFVDFYSMAANKFYGPKGASLNYIKNPSSVEPIICGSPQEESLRAGTQNLPNIIGLCKAFEITCRDYKKINKHEKNLRDLLESRIEDEIPNIRINGKGAKLIDNTLNVSFKGKDRYKLLQQFKDRNILVNIGATYLDEECSHVIRAMYDDEYTKGAIRFSFGIFSKEEDIEKIMKALKEII